PLKDANAEIAQIEAGLKSRTQAIAERGYDAEQVDAEIARERQRERRLGLDFRRPGSAAPAPGAPGAPGANVPDPNAPDPDQDAEQDTAEEAA
ncbi:MAG: phage portal protein, partial [Alphaproteobacteria bacterium HGW-Alphaproteobacteria-5]